jgi:hypothetical protein
MRLFLCLALCACGARRVYNGVQTGGDGVQIEAQRCLVRARSLDCTLDLHNDSGAAVLLDLNQIPVADTHGHEAFRRGRRSALSVAQGERQRVRLVVKGRDVNFLAGAYVRFRGTRVDGSPLRIEPLALGAVQQRTSPAAVASAMAELDAVAAPVHLAAGTRCAALPLETINMDETIGTVMDEVLLAALQNHGLEAIGPEDINAIVGLERVQDSLGCEDSACIAEIGGALGVTCLVAGKLAKVEGSTLVALKLIDVEKARVLARDTRTSRAHGDIPRIIGESVAKLLSK